MWLVWLDDGVILVLRAPLRFEYAVTVARAVYDFPRGVLWPCLQLCFPL